MEPVSELIVACNDIKIKKSLFSKKLVYGEKETPLHGQEFFLNDNDANTLNKSLANASASILAHADILFNGQNKVGVYLTEDGLFAAVRLYRFVPYQYEPRTDWCFLFGDECEPVVKVMQKLPR